MQNMARIGFGCLCLLASLLVMTASARVTQPDQPAADAGGQHDFDWEIGTWKTQVRRLVNPLSGSPEWAEYTGTSVVRNVLDGRANLVELRVEGDTGRIHGASLRLYNPQTRQWSLNYASMTNGMLSRPVFGGFREGRGEFYGQEDIGGRAVLVRFVISDVTADAARFEQAFSVDGGRTWETNWIAIDTRMDDRQEHADSNGRRAPRSAQPRATGAS